VRERTAWTLAFLAAPAAVGLALVAGPVARVLLGPGYDAAAYAGTEAPLRLLALALPALFLNGLLLASLVAASRGPWLPRLTALRVLVALALALPLVTRAGGTGAALGIVIAEWLLLVLAARACRRAAFPIELLRPLAWAVAGALPMALAVFPAREDLTIALPLGAAVQGAVLLSARRLSARKLSQ
jgi:O-antigen/teichoic acid export membrane protein